MKNTIFHIIYYFLGLITFVFTPVYASNMNIGGDASDYFYLENNFYNPELGLYNQESIYNIMSFQPRLSFSLGKNMSGYLSGDISWTHYLDQNMDEDINDFDAEMTSAFFTLSGKQSFLQIGIQPFQFGNGYVFFNNEPGITIEHSPSQRYYIKMEAAQIMASSTIAALSLGYRHSFLEEIEIFSIWYQDNDDKLSEFLNTIIEVAVSDSTIIKNSGGLFWFGANGNLFVGPFYLSGCVIYQTGFPTVTIETYRLWLSRVTKVYSDRSVSISSGLIDLKIDYTLSQDTSVGLVLFYTPGDLSPSSNNITSFFSPIPFNTRTSIFFSGFGMIDGSDGIELAGTRWEGVIAPGINLNFKLLKNMTMDSTLTFLYPEEPQTSDQSMYGWEIDTFISYNILKKIELIFETDVFQYGNFYKTQEGDTPKAASRILIGINGFF